MAEEVRHWHLWRRFQTLPFQRFACTVIEEHHVESGFQIIDHDPKVADSAFLSMFDAHMAQPLKVMTGGHDAERQIDYTEFVVAEPRTSLHFGNAIRDVPGTYLMGEGRKS